MDAKRSQIEALNAADLSLEEYRWIRDQAYRAIGVAYVDLDIAKIVDEAKRGVTSQEAGRLLGASNPRGRSRTELGSRSSNSSSSRMWRSPHSGSEHRRPRPPGVRDICDDRSRALCDGYSPFHSIGYSRTADRRERFRLAARDREQIPDVTS